MAGPITLNRAQYEQTAAGKKPGGTYAKYLGFLAKRRPARMAAAADPLAPRSDAQIRSGVTADVRSQVSPLIAELTRSIGAQTKASMGAIGGYAGKLATDLAPFQANAKSIYGDAQGAQASADSALAQRLTGQGDQLAQELAGKLHGIGMPDPGVDQISGAARTTGAGAGNALYATGSAALANLIAQGAGAQEYAGKLPGIARLGGLQGARELQLSSQQQLAEGSGKIRQQVPGLVSELTRAARATELDKGLARQAYEGKAMGAQVDAAKANADLTYKYDKLTADQQKAATAEAGRNARAAAALKVRQQLAVKNKNGQLTPSQKLKLTKDAGKVAETAYWGVEPKKHYDANTGTWIDQPGTGVPALGYQPALKKLMTEYGLKLAEAQKILDNYYAPGEHGRPLKSYQERQAAKQKGK